MSTEHRRASRQTAKELAVMLGHTSVANAFDEAAAEAAAASAGSGGFCLFGKKKVAKVAPAP